MQPRRITRPVQAGDITIGGTSPIPVQSMTTTDTRDRLSTLDQITALTEAGCEIVRLAVPDQEAADNLAYFVANSRTPLVADIHFDYRLALTAIEAGISKLRINPGNIGGSDRVKMLAAKGQRTRDPDPDRGQRRFPGNRSIGEISRTHPGSHGGERAPSHPTVGGSRF